MTDINDLPPFIDHEIEYEDGEREMHRFFLSLNRDGYGKWSCGYVHFCEDGEMAIPQLVTNSSDTIDEAAIRMTAKLKRFNRLSFQKDTE